MQTVTLKQTNRLYLNTDQTIDAGTISLIDEQGQFIQDDQGADIQDKAITVDGNDYYFEFTPADDAPEGWWRAYWFGSYSNRNVSLEGEFTPEDVQAKPKVQTSEQLVSPTVLETDFLRGIELDRVERFFTDRGYMKAGRSLQDGYREVLLEARGQLEEELDIFFTPRKQVEMHDYEGQDIMTTKWFMQMYKTPILKYLSMDMFFQDNKINDEGIPGDWITIGNPREGRLTVLPFSQAKDNGNLTIAFYSVFYTGLNELLNNNTYITDFFRIEYISGLDWHGKYASELAGGDVDNSAKVALKEHEKQ